jgi:hypothetical protein
MMAHLHRHGRKSLSWIVSGAGSAAQGKSRFSIFTTAKRRESRRAAAGHANRVRWHMVNCFCTFFYKYFLDTHGKP